MRSFAVPPDKPSTVLQVVLGVFFFAFAYFGLRGDGVASAASHKLDVRLLADVGTILYFLVLFWAAGYRLRWLMGVMVPLFYLGEAIFCHGFHWYQYRTPEIPVYVPFGHAVVYASGYMLAHAGIFMRHDGLVRKILLGFYVLTFLYVGIFWNDIFTLVSAVLFFWMMRRKRWPNLYLFIGICVMHIEIVGTHWGCWKWQDVFGVIPTANPPLGALTYYVGGDLVLAKMVTQIMKQKKVYAL